MTEIKGLEFDATPDATGIGRVKFGGRFYGLPVEAITALESLAAALRKAEDERDLKAHAASEAMNIAAATDVQNKSLAADNERLTSERDEASDRNSNTHETLILERVGLTLMRARVTDSEIRTRLAEADAKALRETLKELVRLKALKDTFPALLKQTDQHGYSMAYQQAFYEYERCKPLAWDRARSLSHSPGETNG